MDACDLGLEYEADVCPQGRLRAHPIGALLPITAEERRNPEHPKDQSDRLLGFDFRRMRSRRGAWRAHYTPKLKKRTALLRKLKEVFRRYQSQPVDGSLS